MELSWKNDFDLIDEVENLEDKKVLIVDDDENSRFLAELYLKKLWVEDGNIFVMKNWSDAIEEAKKQIFDIILMDIQMPGLDWIKTATEIKENSDWKIPKIIWYTADVFYKNRKWTNIMDGIIIKPARKGDFEKEIMKVLKENQSN